jgi:hypothetical protein
MSAAKDISMDSSGTSSHPSIIQSLCEKSRVPQSDIEKVLINLSGCILSQEKNADIETLLTKDKSMLSTYDLDSAISAVTNMPRPTVVAITQAMMEIIELVLKPKNNFCGQKVVIGNAIEIQSGIKNSKSTIAKDSEYLSVKVSTTSQFKKKMK